MVQMQLTVEPFASKLNSVLEKNPDFEKIKFYSRNRRERHWNSKIIPNCRSSSRALQLPLWTAKGSSPN
ncbi:Hypothetical protein FKW44_012971 [Caligus rogercresseyi]|uniref:Uncharacterized protein n=1 Tax=Caligus rogercresseyi TaxID=217165 RepID=A0A7T8K9X6_CALRO|nr:Hypothetical protein FKW44_012971 [Caligus rogercresseyi]